MESETKLEIRVVTEAETKVRHGNIKNLGAEGNMEAETEMWAEDCGVSQIGMGLSKWFFIDLTSMLLMINTNT